MKAQDPLPTRYKEVESWLYPKVLGTLPESIREHAQQERRFGLAPRVTDLLFKLLVHMQQGTLDEKDSLHKTLTSPNPCTNPAAALRELRRWYGAVKRSTEIDMPLPSIDLLFRGARSIYVGVFEGDDFELRLRWTSLLQRSGFPHQLTHEGLRDMNQFAEAELTQMVVTGRGSQNTTLPLTDTQRSRLKGEKEADKRRTAAAKASAPLQSSALGRR